MISDSQNKSELKLEIATIGSEYVWCTHNHSKNDKLEITINSIIKITHIEVL